MVATQWLGDLQLIEGELVDAVLENVAGNHGSPVEGKIWYDTVAKKLKFRDDNSNVDPTARAEHTGTQTASTISDFDTAVRTNRIDQLAAAGGDVNLDSHKLVNVTDPTNPQDAATKAYVDAARAGLDVKASVRLATAAALPAYTRAGDVLTANANGGLSVDGTAVAVNDRILVKDGAAGADNGIYVVTATGGAGAPYVLTRADDANTSAEVTAGMFTFVTEGTANADTGWILSTNDAIVLNTTALTFTQFSQAGVIAAGAGLTKTGATIDAVAGAAPAGGGPGGGLKVTADEIVVDSDVVALKKAFNVGNGAATTISCVHNLGTRDVIVQVYLNSGTFETVHVHAERTDANTVDLVFPSAPANNAYRCVIHG